MTITELQTIRAVADHVIPADIDGVSGSIAVPYLLQEIGIGGGARDFYTPLRELLELIQNEARGQDFTALSSEEQEKVLAYCGGDLRIRPSWWRFAELISEGYYTSPEGMALVGFTPVKEVLP